MDSYLSLSYIYIYENFINDWVNATHVSYWCYWKSISGVVLAKLTRSINIPFIISTFTPSIYESHTTVATNFFLSKYTFIYLDLTTIYIDTFSFINGFISNNFIVYVRLLPSFLNKSDNSCCLIISLYLPLSVQKLIKLSHFIDQFINISNDIMNAFY